MFVSFRRRLKDLPDCCPSIPQPGGGAAELERILQDPIVDGIFCCGRKWPSGVCGRILKRLWVRFGDRRITGSLPILPLQGSGNKQK